MVAREVLVLLEQDLVAGSHHDRRTELHGAATRLLLPVSRTERAETCRDLAGLEHGCGTDASSADDLGRRTILVEQNRERHLLVLDEGDCVAPTAGPDSRDGCPGLEDLFVSVADLTGPLTTRQSAEMPEEEENLWLVTPEIAKPVLRVMCIGQDVVC